MCSLSVSVCMATYNGQPFLAEQIDSVLSELAESDELVIVDDASGDGTYELLLGYAAKDHRISVHKNHSNLGVIKTFEYSLSLAKNEIIFLADQDDIWVPGRVKSCLAIFKSHSDVSGVVVNAEILAFHEKTGRRFYAQGSEPSFTIVSQLYKNEIIGCCFAFRKSVLDMALPFVPGISMHDWWLGCCSLLNGKVYFLNENKIYYRRHSSNASPSQRRVLFVVLKSRAQDAVCFIRLLLRLIGKRVRRVQ